MDRSRPAVSLRWMIRLDLPEVLEIERLSSPQPWTRAIFEAELRNRSVIGLVACVGDRIAGHVVYQYTPRSLTVETLGVHPDFRRRGVARAMLARLKTKLDPIRRREISLVVRESATPMHLLLRSEGFRASGVWREFYGTPREDAYVFGYEVAERAPAILSFLTAN